MIHIVSTAGDGMLLFSLCYFLENTIIDRGQWVRDGPSLSLPHIIAAWLRTEENRGLSRDKE